jgi:hypothetical protein
MTTNKRHLPPAFECCTCSFFGCSISLIIAARLADFTADHVCTFLERQEFPAEAVLALKTARVTGKLIMEGKMVDSLAYLNVNIVF